MTKVCCRACEKSAKTKKCKDHAKNDIKGRKGLATIKFVHKQPNFTSSANSRCSKAESKELLDAADKTEHLIRTAYKRWDKKLFKKWFGKGTAHDNENVRLRYKHAMDLMF